MKRKDLLLGSGVLFVACVLFLVMNLMQYVQARDSEAKRKSGKTGCDQGGRRSLRKIFVG